MTGALFVDTGGWVAVQIPNDRWHAQAAAVLREAISGGVPLLTTNHVVGETYSLLVRAHGRPAAWKFLDGIARSSRLERLHVDEPTEGEAVELLRKYKDQPFSFVDGVSFAVMRRRRIRLALAFDRHFAAAGYLRVPLDSELP